MFLREDSENNILFLDSDSIVSPTDDTIIPEALTSDNYDLAITFKVQIVFNSSAETLSTSDIDTDDEYDDEVDLDYWGTSELIYNDNKVTKLINFDSTPSATVEVEGPCSFGEDAGTTQFDYEFVSNSLPDWIDVDIDNDVQTQTLTIEPDSNDFDDGDYDLT